MVENMFGLGIAGGGVILVGGFIYTWISGRKGKDAMFDAKKLKGMLQKKSEDKIESINHEQSQIEVKIKSTEKLAVEKQKAIRQIADKAAEQVEAVMQEDDMSKVTDYINDGANDF